MLVSGFFYACTVGFIVLCGGDAVKKILVFIALDLGAGEVMGASTSKSLQGQRENILFHLCPAGV